MATCSYDASYLPRCVEHEHVDRNRECTWLRVTDINDSGRELELDGPMLRELALALAEHATNLEQGSHPNKTDKLATTRRLARNLGLDDFAGVMWG